MQITNFWVTELSLLLIQPQHFFHISILMVHPYSVVFYSDPYVLPWQVGCPDTHTAATNILILPLHFIPSFFVSLCSLLHLIYRSLPSIFLSFVDFHIVLCLPLCSRIPTYSFLKQSHLQLLSFTPSTLTDLPAFTHKGPTLFTLKLLFNPCSCYAAYSESLWSAVENPTWCSIFWIVS